MSDNQDNAVINLLTSITRDTGQIKTDLAVNTTKTAAIEDHLKQLNGKVVKQEAKSQLLADAEEKNTKFREDREAKQAKNKDRFWNFMEKLLWAIIPGLAIALWKVAEYLISQGVFK